MMKRQIRNGGETNGADENFKAHSSCMTIAMKSHDNCDAIS